MKGQRVSNNVRMSPSTPLNKFLRDQAQGSSIKAPKRSTEKKIVHKSMNINSNKQNSDFVTRPATSLSPDTRPRRVKLPAVLNPESLIMAKAPTRLL